MAGKKEGTPNAMPTATEAELTSAEKVRNARQAIRTAKAAASQGKVGVTKADKGRQADRRKNAFGIAASASKATAVTSAIISRARRGRGR
jgi:hypothetical protein